MRGEDDEVLEAAMRREIARRMGEIIRAAAMAEIEIRDRTGAFRDDAGCRYHRTTVECLGTAVLRAIGEAGYSVEIAEEAALARAALDHAEDDGMILVAPPAPSMLVLMAKPEPN